MKRLLLYISLFLLVVIFIFKATKDNFYHFKINGKDYKLLTASDIIEWEKGLMYYKSKQELKGADGMIFIFPDKQYRTFWNENTYLNLDLYWVNDDKVVGKSFLPSILKSKNIVTVSSNEEVNKVIELVE